MKDPNFGMTNGFSTMTMPLCVMRLEFASFWPKNPLQKMYHSPYSPDLAPCDFLVLYKIKKYPEGTKIC
jgi:hypothetical protein